MDCYHNSQKKASLFDLYQLVVCEHSGFVLVHNKKIMISYIVFGKLFIPLQKDNDGSLCLGCLSLIII